MPVNHSGAQPAHFACFIQNKQKERLNGKRGAKGGKREEVAWRCAGHRVHGTTPAHLLCRPPSLLCVCIYDRQTTTQRCKQQQQKHENKKGTHRIQTWRGAARHLVYAKQRGKTMGELSERLPLLGATCRHATGTRHRGRRNVAVGMTHAKGTAAVAPAVFVFVVVWRRVVRAPMQISRTEKRGQPLWAETGAALAHPRVWQCPKSVSTKSRRKTTRKHDMFDSRNKKNTQTKTLARSAQTGDEPPS